MYVKNGIDQWEKKNPHEGDFYEAGPTRIPDGLVSIGTTSCVTNQA